MISDEEEAPRPRFLSRPPLDRLGVAELSAYIEELRAEIARAEAEIGRKSSHRSAAEAVFRGR